MASSGQVRAPAAVRPCVDAVDASCDVPAYYIVAESQAVAPGGEAEAQVESVEEAEADDMDKAEAEATKLSESEESTK